MIHVVTPSVRSENLPKVHESIVTAKHHTFAGTANWKWWVVRDLSQQPWNPSSVDNRATMLDCHKKGAAGHPGRNIALNWILEQDPEGHVCFIDDDTVMHPQYFNRLEHLTNLLKKHAFVVDQITPDERIRCTAAPACMRPCGVDTGQVLFPAYMARNAMFAESLYEADGYFYQEIHSLFPERFVFINEPLSIYNALR